MSVGNSWKRRHLVVEDRDHRVVGRDDLARRRGAAEQHDPGFVGDDFFGGGFEVLGDGGHRPVDAARDVDDAGAFDRRSCPRASARSRRPRLRAPTSASTSRNGCTGASASATGATRASGAPATSPSRTSASTAAFCAPPTTLLEQTIASAPPATGMPTRKAGARRDADVDRERSFIATRLRRRRPTAPGAGCDGSRGSRAWPQA